MIYTVWIVSPLGYGHSEAFREVSESLRDALVELGHQASVVASPELCRGRVVVLGAHLLRYSTDLVLPSDTVIFNTEQLGSGSEFTDQWYLELLGKFEVWDYSALNLGYLQDHGVSGHLCEIGYTRSLTRIAPVVEDIDVLFIGSNNPRREKIFNDLASSGIRVLTGSNIYGVERDELIARSKIILNIHFYEAKIFEIVRCSYLMANWKCIVSETGLDIDLEEPYREGIAFVEYDGLVDKIKELLGNDTAREKYARMGFEFFSSKLQTESLRELVC